MIVGFTGPFGDANFGDYAMLVNNMYDISPKESIIFTYNDELLSLLKNDYLKKFNFEECIVDIDYGFNPKFGKDYVVEYDDYCETPLEIIARAKNLNEIRRYVSKIDILIVNGGGYFNHIWNAKHRKKRLYSILTPILIANEMNKKIIFAGNTYGPFDKSDKFFCSFFCSLHNVEYYSRDDVYSINWLRQLGIDEKIKLIPDDLYFVNNNIQKKKEIRYEKYIVLELYASINDINKLIEDIKSLVDCMMEKYNCNVVLVPLDKEYGGEIQSEMIKNKINQVEYFDFGNNKYRKIEDIINLVSNAEFVLCQRYHMFVFAMANKTPAIHILKDVCGDKRYYYTKSMGLLKQLFANTGFEQDKYMVNNISNGITFLLNEFEDIKAYQNEMFIKVKDNEIKMRKNRNDFIKRLGL